MTGFLIFDDFLNSFSTLERLSQALDYNAADIETFKIFTRMTSADTVSINRLGDTIRLDDHWASFVLQLAPGTNEKATCDNLEGLFPLVRFAHINFVVEAAVDQFTLRTRPNDAAYLPSQANLHPTQQYPDGHINAQFAWYHEKGSNTIKVGVLDTGIDFRHEEFNNGANGGPKVIGGWDWVNNRPQSAISDINGHGTAVAGIIGARRNNGLGIAGIAGGNGSSAADVGVQLFDLKILDDTGLGTIANLAAAIVEGAAYNPSTGYGYGLDLLNLSARWYNNYPNINNNISTNEVALLAGAMRSAFSNNVTFVAIKGNEGTNLRTYPADYRDGWAVSVGASGTNGQRKDNSNGDPSVTGDNYTSNYGNGIDLMAPGTAALVYTTRSANKSSGSGRYQTFNGTSAAAPHVTGVAALLLSQVNDSAFPYGNLAPEDVEQILQRSATDRGTAGYDDYTGYGLLNAGNAVITSRKDVYNFKHAADTHLNFTRTQQNTRVVLAGAYGATAAGTYYADVYRGTTQIYNAFSVYNGYQLVDVWARNSSSNLWSGANPITPEPDIDVTHDQTWAYITGYTYFIRSDIQGRQINRWIPVNPFTGPIPESKVSITYYTYNASLDEPMMRSQQTYSSDLAEAYPNPADDQFSLRFTTSAPIDEATIDVYSLTGTHVKNIQVTRLGKGEHTIQISINELAAGLYTYRLLTDERVEMGKIMKR